MNLRLYMDVHAPSVITRTLQGRGLDVLASQDDGTTELDDEALLARAAALGRLLFSQDQDLLRIASQWQAEGRPFEGVAFSQQRGVSLGILISDLEILLTCADPEEVRNAVTFLPFTS